MTRAPSDSRAFQRWNEEMVQRYDIERYYAELRPALRWLERRRIDLIFKLAAPGPGDAVLEVGCGAGHVLAAFNGFERTGLDLSPRMLARAARRLGADTTLTCGSAEQLPFDDASFDVVVCTEVLEHTQDPQRVVAELMRVAAPGARVVVSIPNEKNIDFAKRLLRRTPVLNRLLANLASEGNEWHLHRFDRALLESTVQSHARIVRLQGLPFAWPALRYVAQLGTIPVAEARK